MGGTGTKPKLLLIAYRAFGDWVYTVPVLPYLFKQYDVHLECNLKVHALAYDDPRFCGITVFDDRTFIKSLNSSPRFDCNTEMQRHLQSVFDAVKPDRVIDLSRSLEDACISSQGQEIFHAPREERAARFGHLDYYEAVFKHCGVDVPEGITLDAMHFTPEQERVVKQWRDRHTSDFLVMVPPLGSCMQKFYPRMPEVIQHIVGTYHNAHVYLMGEAGIIDAEAMRHERAHDMTGKVGIKQSILMTKYADYVIGPETGLVVAAGMFGTHKTMLCNTVRVSQVCGKHRNDHSLQSGADCSPCHRGIYVEEDCDDIRYADGVPYSGCVHGWDFDAITSIIAEVYDQRNIYNAEYYRRYTERAQSEIGRAIYASRWDLVEKHCHGRMTLLDYGCASGAFHQSSRNGFITYGYDINPNSPFREIPEAKIDILTMWDVIEHLHDPAGELRKLDAEWVFVSTPNAAAVEGDITNWRHYRPDEHLHYFDLESLTGVFDRAGYDVVEHAFSEGALRNPEKPDDIITVVAKRRSREQ